MNKDLAVLCMKSVVLMMVLIMPVTIISVRVCWMVYHISKAQGFAIILLSCAVGIVTVKETVMVGKGWAVYFRWLLWGGILPLLLSTSMIDLKERLIPNVLPLTLIGWKILILICQLSNHLVEWKQIGFDLLCGIVCGVLLLLVSKVIYDGVEMGDTKLLAAIAVACGVEIVWTTFLLALLFFVIVIILMLLRKKMLWNDSLPFSPFILAGYAGTLLLLIK